MLTNAFGITPGSQPACVNCTQHFVGAVTSFPLILTATLQDGYWPPFKDENGAPSGWGACPGLHSPVTEPEFKHKLVWFQLLRYKLWAHANSNQRNSPISQAGSLQFLSSHPRKEGTKMVKESSCFISIRRNFSRLPWTSHRCRTWQIAS